MSMNSSNNNNNIMFMNSSSNNNNNRTDEITSRPILHHLSAAKKERIPQKTRRVFFSCNRQTKEYRKEANPAENVTNTSIELCPKMVPGILRQQSKVQYHLPSERETRRRKRRRHRIQFVNTAVLPRKKTTDRKQLQRTELDMCRKRLSDSYPIDPPPLQKKRSTDRKQLPETLDGCKKKLIDSLPFVSPPINRKRQSDDSLMASEEAPPPSKRRRCEVTAVEPSTEQVEPAQPAEFSRKRSADGLLPSEVDPPKRRRYEVTVVEMAEEQVGTLPVAVMQDDAEVDFVSVDTEEEDEAQVQSPQEEDQPQEQEVDFLQVEPLLPEEDDVQPTNTVGRRLTASLQREVAALRSTLDGYWASPCSPRQRKQPNRYVPTF